MHSIFEIFKIGVGPSSSHTMGPMIAANRFRSSVSKYLSGAPNQNAHFRITVKLYGSLALTGIGHATDSAILAGLSGCLPSTSETEEIQKSVQQIRESGILTLPNNIQMDWEEPRDLIWLGNEFMPEHPNAMKFQLWNQTPTSQVQGGESDGETMVPLLEEDYFSTGGGFVYDRKELSELQASKIQACVVHTTEDRKSVV